MSGRVKISVFSIIPALPNGLVLSFMNILRCIHRRRIYEKKIESRVISAKHKDSINRNNGFIEDQNSYSDISYGKCSVQYSGCEIIATYNALYHLGDSRYDLIELIHRYELDGCMLSGKWGSAPSAICDFFKSEGYFVKEFKQKEPIDFTFDTFILVLYNDRYDIRKEIHTVCVTKDEGYYTAHNMYCNGRIFGKYKSIEALLQAHNNGNAKQIYLLGIKGKINDRSTC